MLYLNLITSIWKLYEAKKMFFGPVLSMRAFQGPTIKVVAGIGSVMCNKQSFLPTLR